MLYFNTRPAIAIVQWEIDKKYRLLAIENTSGQAI